MKIKLSDGGWNPYFAGALVGILSLISIIATTYIGGRTSFLGASTTFVRAAGFIVRSIDAGWPASNEYFSARAPRVDWQFMLVIGILLGAAIASLGDKSFKNESVPPIWNERFGGSVLLRAFWAFTGGVLVMIGARLADGCTSGHGLSGMMQLSVSGLAALLVFFAVGIITANLIYGRKRP